MDDLASILVQMRLKEPLLLAAVLVIDQVKLLPPSLVIQPSTVASLVNLKDPESAVQSAFDPSTSDLLERLLA